MSSNAIRWLEAPDEHDYPAALSYLSLIFDPAKAKSLVNALKRTKVAEFHAKDIFRASGLHLLGVSNSHVEKNEKKMKSGNPLSPVLLVRAFGKVIVADGYHRVCAVYQHDEDAMIPCKIV